MKNGEIASTKVPSTAICSGSASAFSSQPGKNSSEHIPADHVQQDDRQDQQATAAPSRSSVIPSRLAEFESWRIWSARSAINKPHQTSN